MSQVLNDVNRSFGYEFYEQSKALSGVRAYLADQPKFRVFLKLRRRIIEGELRQLKLMLKTANGLDAAAIYKLRTALKQDLNRINHQVKDLRLHTLGAKKAEAQRELNVMAMHDQCEKVGVDGTKLLNEVHAEIQARKALDNESRKLAD